jgi:hypothetical protein
MRQIREILRLRLECKLTERQVAASIGVSKGSVRNYARKARDCRQRARRGPKSAASAETKEPGGGNRTWIRLSHGCEENTGRAIPKLGEAGLLDPARSGCCWPIFAYRVFRSLSVGSGQSKVLSGVAGYDLGFAERYPFPSMMKVSARSISLSAIT